MLRHSCLIADTEKTSYVTPQQSVETAPAVATAERQKNQISKLQSENEAVSETAEEVTNKDKRTEASRLQNNGFVAVEAGTGDREGTEPETEDGHGS